MIRNVRKIGHTSQDYFSELILFCFVTLSAAFFPTTPYISLSQFKIPFAAFIEMVVTFDKRYYLALLRDLVVFTKAWPQAFLSKLVWILDVVYRSLVGFTVSESTVLTVLCL